MHPNLRRGKKGQPGAAGTGVSRRKAIAALAWVWRVRDCGAERDGRVVRGLKSQIWASVWRERSAKRIVVGAEGGWGAAEGGKVAAKRQCREGVFWEARMRLYSGLLWGRWSCRTDMRTVWARSWGQRWNATPPAITSDVSIFISNKIYEIESRILSPFDITRKYIFIIGALI